jgi:peptidoglycan/xylan/chitin deacetylase (PgdA/CDA1 family)
MNPLRHLEPLRAGLRRLRKAGAPKCAILAYHRVAPSGVDPWRLNVTPEHFAQHLEVLRACARPVPLASLVEDLDTGRFTGRGVAVTFDDGYANTLTAAAALEACDVPATVYVTTGYTDVQREFWWDELDQLLLHMYPLPSRCDLSLGGQPRSWELGPAATLGHEPAAPGFPAAPGTRLAFYLEVWRALAPLAHEVRRDALDQLSAWSGVPRSPREDHRPMTRAEVVRLAEHPLVDVGAHTVSHPRLPDLSPAGQWDEIVRSRERLELLLTRPVRSFCYPFGAWTRAMRSLVRDARFSSATTVVAETTWRRSHPFSLPRFVVRDCDGAEFERQLRRWLVAG